MESPDNIPTETRLRHGQMKKQSPRLETGGFSRKVNSKYSLSPVQPDSNSAHNHDFLPLHLPPVINFQIKITFLGAD